MPEFLGDVATALAAISLGTYDESEGVIKQALDTHAPVQTAIDREIVYHVSTKKRGKL